MPMTNAAEHKFFFQDTIGDQYFQKDPAPKNIIKDVESLLNITDFEAIGYPIEVPKAGQPRTYVQIQNAEDMRQEVEFARKKRKLPPVTLPPTPVASTGYSLPTTPGTPTFTTNEARLGESDAETTTSNQITYQPTLKLILDGYMERFSNSMLSFSAAALRTPGGSSLSSQERTEVDNLMASFVQKVRHARIEYEAALAGKGIALEKAGELSDAQEHQSTVADLVVTAGQPSLHRIPSAIKLPEIIDLAEGYITSEDEV
jgi:hypothetical protein